MVHQAKMVVSNGTPTNDGTECMRTLNRKVSPKIGVVNHPKFTIRENMSIHYFAKKIVPFEITYPTSKILGNHNLRQSPR
jgi:hypothetical protein